MTGFTGVDAPYEAPESPDLTLDTSIRDVESCVEEIIARLA
ncbi:MAG: adenylyl-sulfate kinase [Acidimicrobiia bacterium]